MAQNNEVWWTAPALADNGRTVLVSGRDGMDSAMASGKYKERVQITWTYDCGPDGLPDTPTAELMEQADEALRRALRLDKGCLLTGVYTGDGQRDWVLYVKSVGIFTSMLNRAWAELPLLPVTLSAEKDPDWLEYSEMKENTYIPDGE